MPGKLVALCYGTIVHTAWSSPADHGQSSVNPTCLYTNFARISFVPACTNRPGFDVITTSTIASDEPGTERSTSSYNDVT